MHIVPRKYTDTGKFTNRILIELSWSRLLANTKKHSKESYIALHVFLAFNDRSCLTIELDEFPFPLQNTLSSA